MRVEGEVFMFPMLCTCGHHADAHHNTPAGRLTWCGVWSPNRCDCLNYEPQPEEQDITE